MTSLEQDSLTLEGLGGFFNAERFVLRPGQSATVGASSLASFSVTLCRNFERLKGRAPVESMLEKMAPEHVRFVYLGDGRLRPLEDQLSRHQPEPH